MENEYIGLINISRLTPCMADANKIRVFAEANRELSDILPYLNMMIPNALYSKKLGLVAYKKDLSMINIFASGRITVTQVKNEDEALKILGEIRARLNEIYAKRDRIQLSVPKMEISVLDAYNYLPKTNCKDCGCESCMAFALALLDGKRTLNKCMHLLETKNIRNRAALAKRLRLAGY